MRAYASEWSQPETCYDCGGPRDLDAMTVCASCLAGFLDGRGAP